MPKGKLVIASPKLEHALKNLVANPGITDLSTAKKQSLKQQIVPHQVKNEYIYDGVFAITKNETGAYVGDGVAVVNGEINSRFGQQLTFSGAGWIYLEASYGGNVLIKFSSTTPTGTISGESSKGIFPIGKIDESGNVIQLCRSVPHILVVGTDCDESESSSAS